MPDGEAVTRIDVAMPHGAVITGRVVDEFGEPVADAQVMPLHMQYTPTGKRPVIAGRNGMTQRYRRISTLRITSGQYIVSAISRPQAMNPDLSDDHTGYATSYFPGTANLADAQIAQCRHRPADLPTHGDSGADAHGSRQRRRAGQPGAAVRRDGLVGAMTRGNGHRLDGIERVDSAGRDVRHRRAASG